MFPDVSLLGMVSSLPDWGRGRGEERERGEEGKERERSNEYVYTLFNSLVILKNLGVLSNIYVTYSA